MDAPPHSGPGEPTAACFLETIGTAMQLTPLDAATTLQREFLHIRARILELAADLDRLDRGAGDPGDPARLDQIARALAVLSESGPGRAERVQMIFSRPSTIRGGKRTSARWPSPA